MLDDLLSGPSPFSSFEPRRDDVFPTRIGDVAFQRPSTLESMLDQPLGFGLLARDPGSVMTTPERIGDLPIWLHHTMKLRITGELDSKHPHTTMELGKRPDPVRQNWR